MHHKKNAEDERKTIIKSLRILEYQEEDIDKTLREHGYEGLNLKKHPGELSIAYIAINNLTYVILGFVALSILVWARLAPKNFSEYFPIIIVVMALATFITLTIRFFTGIHPSRKKYLVRETWESDFTIGLVFSTIIFLFSPYINLLAMVFLIVIPVFLMLIGAYKLLFEEAFPAAAVIGFLTLLFAHFQPRIIGFLVNLFTILTMGI